MRYVLDAWIAIAAMKPTEPLHVASAWRIDRVLTGVDTLVVPSLFAVEVTAGLTRSGVPAGHVERYVAALLASTDVVTIGPRSATHIARIAARTHLRAADAAYVWVAAREGLSLVTADEEIHQRAGVVCSVERP